MLKRWRLAATVLGLTTALASCATGAGTGLGGSPTGTGGTGGGSTTTTSHASSSSSGTGGTGGMTSTSSASSSSSSSSGSTLCGNGVIDPGEECDGTSFGTATCQSEGLGSGTLTCNTSCHIVVSSCQPLENCTNGQDDNNNNLVDCQDPDCTSKPVCLDSCPTTFTAMIGDFIDGDTTGRPNVHRASCSSATSGPEQIFQVTAPSTGTMSLDLTQNGIAAYSLSVRTACATDSSEIVCTNTPDPKNFGDLTLGVQVVMGQTYFVMVEGLTPTDLDSFSLYIDMPGPEDVCDDFSDNDFDGYVDCDDPTACQTMAACMPGATPTGQACTANTDCTANHNDPVCLADFQFSQFPLGYCSEFCDVVAQDCSAGNICYAGLHVSKNGVCLHTCASDADCRTADGYACVSAGLSKKVCMIAPETACNDYKDNDSDGLTDCHDPSSCQSTPACTPGPTAIGKHCAQHNECTATAGVNDPYCFDETNQGYPNGYCSHFCDPASATDCITGTSCVSRGPNSEDVCMVNCTTDADCRMAEGYFCTFDNVCDYL